MSSTLTVAVNCNLKGHQFVLNFVSAVLGTCTAGILGVIYTWNGMWLIPLSGKFRSPETRELYTIPADLLSSLGVSVVTVVVVVAVGHSIAFPQPLEGTGLLIVLLAQDTIIGFQDHYPKHLKGGLVKKAAGLFAVALVAWALSDALEKYISVTGNGFKFLHDPNHQIVIAYVLLGVGGAVGLVQLLVLGICRTRSLNGDRFLKILSASFTLLQAATAGTSIYFGANTLAQGCRVFNAMKITTIAALGAGILYSVLITWFRLRSTLLAENGAAKNRGDRNDTGSVTEEEAKDEVSMLPSEDLEMGIMPLPRAVLRNEQGGVPGPRHVGTSLRVPGGQGVGQRRVKPR